MGRRGEASMYNDSILYILHTELIGKVHNFPTQTNIKGHSPCILSCWPWQWPLLGGHVCT